MLVLHWTAEVGLSQQLLALLLKTAIGLQRHETDIGTPVTRYEKYKFALKWMEKHSEVIRCDNLTGGGTKEEFIRYNRTCSQVNCIDYRWYSIVLFYRM